MRRMSSSKSARRCTGWLGNFTLSQLQKPFTLKCSRVPQSPTTPRCPPLPLLLPPSCPPFPPPLFPPCPTYSSSKFAAAYSLHAVTRWTATLQGLRCPANVRLEYRWMYRDRAVPKTKPTDATGRVIVSNTNGHKKFDKKLRGRCT